MGPSPLLPCSLAPSLAKASTTHPKDGGGASSSGIGRAGRARSCGAPRTASARSPEVHTRQAHSVVLMSFFQNTFSITSDVAPAKRHRRAPMTEIGGLYFLVYCVIIAFMSSSPSERHTSGALRPECGGASVGDPWTPYNRRPPVVWRIPCQRPQGMTNQKQRSVGRTTLGTRALFLPPLSITIYCYRQVTDLFKTGLFFV